jgi:hypothetical protein
MAPDLSPPAIESIVILAPMKTQLVSSRFYMHVCIVIDLQENPRLLFQDIIAREMGVFFLL